MADEAIDLTDFLTKVLSPAAENAATVGGRAAASCSSALETESETAQFRSAEQGGKDIGGNTSCVETRLSGRWAVD